MAHVVLAGQVCGIPLRKSRSVCVGSPVSMLPLIVQPPGVPLPLALASATSASSAGVSDFQAAVSVAVAREPA